MHDQVKLIKCAVCANANLRHTLQTHYTLHGMQDIFYGELATALSNSGIQSQGLAPLGNRSPSVESYVRFCNGGGSHANFNPFPPLPPPYLFSRPSRPFPSSMSVHLIQLGVWGSAVNSRIPPGPDRVRPPNACASEVKNKFRGLVV